MELVFDLEADGYRDEATRAWCICTADIATGQSLSFDPTCINQGVDLLNTADVLIGHNIIDYDLPLLERLYGWKPNPKTKIIDTVVISRLLRSDRLLPVGCPGSARPHSLEAWGYRVGRGKPEHNDWTQYSEAMLTRCKEDVAINVLVYRALLQEANGPIDWTQSIELEHDVSRIILRQELNGCPVDLPLIWKTRARCVQRMSEISDVVVPLIPEVPLPKSKQSAWPTKQFKKDGSPSVAALRYYGDQFTSYRTDFIIKTAPVNLRSPGQVKDYLLSIGWKPLLWNYKKDSYGKPLRDANGDKVKASPKLELESLESCAWPEDTQDMGDKIVEFLMVAHREGMLRGWLRDVRPDGRIAARAIAQGTPTGRMTHRGIVNVPRKTSPMGEELRSCFTSVPGYTRVGIDLKSCQLYGLAHYLDDAEYTEQLLAGRPHEYTAEKAGLVGDAKSSAKDKGKKLNYTILFGGGDQKVAADLGLTVEKAKEMRATFFANLPALPTLLNKLEGEWKRTGGYLIGLDGRAIFVRSKHMLLVYLMQALESVIIKSFLVRMDKLHTAYDFQLVTVSHDETQYLVLDEHVEPFKIQAGLAIEAINEKYQLKCPQAVDISTGTTWAECH